MPEKINAITVNSKASNPGQIDLNYLRWVRLYPLWPLLLAGGLIGSFVLTNIVSTYFVILNIILLGINFLYWRRMREHFLFGCVNPAVVVSLHPLLIAVYTDLSMTDRRQYPVVKIVPLPLKHMAGKLPEIGQQIATVALYNYNMDNETWYWKDFSPFAVECATADQAVNERTLQSITEEEWSLLQASLATLAEPYNPGLYPIPIAAIRSLLPSDSSEELLPNWEEEINSIEEFPPLLDENNNACYCAGLTCVAERQISDAERKEMLKARRMALLAGNLLLLGGIVSFLVFILTLSVQLTMSIIVVLVLALSAFAMVFMLVKMKDFFAKAKVFHKDIKSGQVRVFRGRLFPDSWHGFEGYKLRLLKKQILLEDMELIQSLEIMTGSGRIAFANDICCHNIEIAEVQVVAAPPEFAVIARQKEWMEEIAQTEDGDKLFMNRRELSESECQELLALAKKTESGYLLLLILLTAWVSAVISAGIFTKKNIADIPFLFYILLFITLLYWFLFILAKLRARNLRRISTNREVIILRGNSENPLNPDDVIEMLPGKPHIVWTENGKPAAWRMNRK